MVYQKDLMNWWRQSSIKRRWYVKYFRRSVYFKWRLRLRMVNAVWVVRDKRFNCGTVLIVIKMYKYIIYVEIFVTVNWGTRQDNGHTIRSLKKYIFAFVWLLSIERRLANTVSPLVKFSSYTAKESFKPYTLTDWLISQT